MCVLMCVNTLDLKSTVNSLSKRCIGYTHIHTYIHTFINAQRETHHLSGCWGIQFRHGGDEEEEDSEAEGEIDCMLNIISLNETGPPPPTPPHN